MSRSFASYKSNAWSAASEQGTMENFFLATLSPAEILLNFAHYQLYFGFGTFVPLNMRNSGSCRSSNRKLSDPFAKPTPTTFVPSSSAKIEYFRDRFVISDRIRLSRPHHREHTGFHLLSLFQILTLFKFRRLAQNFSYFSHAHRFFL